MRHDISVNDMTSESKVFHKETSVSNSIPSRSSLRFVYNVITALSLRLGEDVIRCHQQAPPLCGLFWRLFLLNFTLERYLVVTFCYHTTLVSSTDSYVSHHVSVGYHCWLLILVCRYKEIHLLNNVWHWPWMWSCCVSGTFFSPFARATWWTIHNGHTYSYYT